jgi:hypothetical protein
MTADPGDPLDALREQLDRTHDAARRLAREAAGAARPPPPAGWQATGSPPPRGELAALLGFADAVRDGLPPDLWERFVAVLRELLLALRALIDYLVERLEARRPPPADVQDIPIS